MKSTKLKQYRQGDVLVERIASIPTTAKRCEPEAGRIILAHGEVTGHHHSIDADAADWWKEEGSQTQYVEVREDTPMDHQEHGPIPMEPGPYRVIRQRVYTPEAIRNVAD